jgi:hypothetical protein
MAMLQGLPTNTILSNLPHIVTAIGGLGTAAFGMVDAIKPIGVNHIGFTRISDGVKGLTPDKPATPPAANGNINNAQAVNAPAVTVAASALPQAQVLASLKANWYNGTDLSSQKSIAKSLIKMGLNPNSAPDLAKATGINSDLLKAVATKITNGVKLEPNESDVFSRFDFSLTAQLDELYQHADQVYRNWTRILAALFAIALAFVGGWTLNDGTLSAYLHSNDLWLALVAGVLATPLAPIAKDLSTALSTAVNTMQAVKK